MNLLRLFLALALGILGSSEALSKPQLNSLCYLEDHAHAEVQGSNSKQLYEIASVSKIVTSFWALQRLGPQYRFKTRLLITPVSPSVFDIHVAGGRDPFFGREMSYFLFSELSKLNIRTVRNLTFDENFIFNWKVRETPTRSYEIIPSRTEAWMKDRLKFNAKEYSAVRSAAASLGITMAAAPQIRISNVQFLSKQNYRFAEGVKTVELRSAPLFRYLKEMNRVSNNHVADRLFELLGGSAAFQPFIKERMNMDMNDIRFYNGSGDSVHVESGNAKKVYNEASCDALVHILDAMRDLLKKSDLDLKNIMAVSGMETKSTLSGHYSFPAVSGAMVAKTGTVDPAVALAGMISTEKGDVYFGILYATNGSGDWRRGRDAIRSQLGMLMAKFGGKETFSYESRAFLPFDSASGLTEILPNTPIKLPLRTP
jgi:D-alanyl-D-alanine carboxypeptidase